MARAAELRRVGQAHDRAGAGMDERERGGSYAASSSNRAK